ncbi:MAG: MFS transporter [Planctomycetota bacterium]
MTSSPQSDSDDDESSTSTEPSTEQPAQPSSLSGDASVKDIEADPEYQRNSLNIILFTCLLIIGDSLFDNGALFNLLNAALFSASQIMVLMHLHQAIYMLAIVPMAFYSDRIGKKRVGVIGLLLLTVALFAFSISTMTPNAVAKGLSILGVSVYGFGYAMYVAGWYALLSPIIPERVRGRFFGKMRFTWQTIGIGFTLLMSQLMKNPSPMVFGIIFFVSAVSMFIGIYFYNRIEEAEKPKPSKLRFIETVMTAARTPGYMPFCAYIFLLMLFTGACPTLFNLVCVKALAFTPRLILVMGVLLLIGRAIGFVIGGKLVDKKGTRFVFLMSHFAFGIILFLFLFRGAMPDALVPFYIGALICGFGMAWASSFIATSTEMLAIAPQENKSVATAITMMLKSGGNALSGLLCGASLSLGFLNTNWTLFGQTLTQYDVPILAFSIMIVLLIVTLGLIPSVIRKANWLPNRRF